MLRAGKDENVSSNLRQYGLADRYLDVLVADAAKNVWRQGELFDAIITDRRQSFFPSLTLDCVFTCSSLWDQGRKAENRVKKYTKPSPT